MPCRDWSSRSSGSPDSPTLYTTDIVLTKTSRAASRTDDPLFPSSQSKPSGAISGSDQLSYPPGEKLWREAFRQPLPSPIAGAARSPPGHALSRHSRERLDPSAPAVWPHIPARWHCCAVSREKPKQNIDAQNPPFQLRRRNNLDRSHICLNNTLSTGSFIGRQFHDQHGSAALEKRLLEQPCHQQSANDAQQVIPSIVSPLSLRKPRNTRVRDAGRDQDCVDRQTGAEQLI